MFCRGKETVNNYLNNNDNILVCSAIKTYLVLLDKP